MKIAYFLSKTAELYQTINERNMRAPRMAGWALRNVYQYAQDSGLHQLAWSS
jgi:hypothetical protein